jgi:hypothetical protein
MNYDPPTVIFNYGVYDHELVFLCPVLSRLAQELSLPLSDVNIMNKRVGDALPKLYIRRWCELELHEATWSNLLGAIYRLDMDQSKYFIPFIRLVEDKLKTKIDDRFFFI